MEIKVKYSLETEAIRIYATAIGVLEGWYMRNHWYSVQQNVSFDKTLPTVLMPDINYIEVLQDITEPKLRDFFEPIKKSEKKAVDSVKKQLVKTKQFTSLSQKDLIQIKKQQEKILLPAIEKIRKTLNYLENKKFEVTAIPTEFGTCGSFRVLKNIEDTKKIHIQIYLRLDQPPKSSLELLASILTRPILDSSPNILWRETEAVSDFLTQYVFGYAEHISTIDRVSGRNPKLLKISINFLRSHGLPTGEIFKYDLDNNKIYVISHDISGEFSPYEFRLLRSLIENKNFTVSFDEISEALYNSHSYEKFSMWGITKTVQRVRDKLETQGIPRDAIVNVKGEGFKLVV